MDPRARGARAEQSRGIVWPGRAAPSLAGLEGLHAGKFHRRRCSIGPRRPVVTHSLASQTGTSNHARSDGRRCDSPPLSPGTDPTVAAVRAGAVRRGQAILVLAESEAIDGDCSGGQDVSPEA
jgi:hypothetical protein